MIIKDLISKKDYDYVSYRLLVETYDSQDPLNVFAGCFASKDGKIISLDGDRYDELEEVLEYEEWHDKKRGITNGLTIVCPEPIVQ